ncbi:hypothetical protein AGMMS49990_10160 [Endomicrobiia bacterium]|nr:hypothetical protein AGMMS49990_10160 [Endomicrobiia bacterium]
MGYFNKGGGDISNGFDVFFDGLREYVLIGAGSVGGVGVESGDVVGVLVGVGGVGFGGFSGVVGGGGIGDGDELLVSGDEGGEGDGVFVDDDDVVGVFGNIEGVG